jgi:hypothetical protein
MNIVVGALPIDGSIPKNLMHTTRSYKPDACKHKLLIKKIRASGNQIQVET